MDGRLFFSLKMHCGIIIMVLKKANKIGKTGKKFAIETEKSGK